jgi:hypothetical protein
LAGLYIRNRGGAEVVFVYRYSSSPGGGWIKFAILPSRIPDDNGKAVGPLWGVTGDLIERGDDLAYWMKRKDVCHEEAGGEVRSQLLDLT